MYDMSSASAAFGLLMRMRACGHGWHAHALKLQPHPASPFGLAKPWHAGTMDSQALSVTLIAAIYKAKASS